MALALVGGQAHADQTLLNVSYDPTRELYQEFNKAFADDWKQKTGQAVTMPSGTPHNRLLLSLCHAMGMTDTTAFGNPKFCTDGPITEIVA